MAKSSIKCLATPDAEWVRVYHVYWLAKWNVFNLIVNYVIIAATYS
jgi:hypothetical protein